MSHKVSQGYHDLFGCVVPSHSGWFWRLGTGRGVSVHGAWWIGTCPTNAKVLGHNGGKKLWGGKLGPRISCLREAHLQHTQG